MSLGNCNHDWMPFGSSQACRKCGADIRAQNSACPADYPTELRKMADLIERSGLGRTADMVRGGAAEIERLRGAIIVLSVALRDIREPITAAADAETLSALQDLHELMSDRATRALIDAGLAS